MDTDTRAWGAFALQTGTRERLYVSAATKKEVDVLLFGRAVPAARDTVQYVRISQGGKR